MEAKTDGDQQQRLTVCPVPYQAQALWKSGHLQRTPKHRGILVGAKRPPGSDLKPKSSLRIDVAVEAQGQKWLKTLQ
jgi:hypothetical protein